MKQASEWIVLGASRLNLPLMGGTLVARPDVVLVSDTDTKGAQTQSFGVPRGLPSRLSTFSQFWIVDPASVAGLAASNGLVVITP